MCWQGWFFVIPFAGPACQSLRTGGRERPYKVIYIRSSQAVRRTGEITSRGMQIQQEITDEE